MYVCIYIYPLRSRTADEEVEDINTRIGAKNFQAAPPSRWYLIKTHAHNGRRAAVAEEELHAEKRYLSLVYHSHDNNMITPSSPPSPPTLPALPTPRPPSLGHVVFRELFTGRGATLHCTTHALHTDIYTLRP